MDNNILARYMSAQSIMSGYLTNRLVLNDAVFPHWIIRNDGSDSYCFWYRKETTFGKEIRLVDARARTNITAFDHQVLAEELTQISGQLQDGRNLPLTNLSIDLDPMKVFFEAFGKRWVFSSGCRLSEVAEDVHRHFGITSPDGRKVAFVREHDVYVRDEVSGKEKRLTSDGAEDNCYGGTYWNIDTNVQILWSPDSTHLFVVQLNTKGVKTLPRICYAPPNTSSRPIQSPLKMACIGDEFIERYRLVVINIVSGVNIEPDYPEIPYPYHGPENYAGYFTGNLGWWSSDSRSVCFIDISRGSKKISVMHWDIYSGVIRKLFEEVAETYLKICDDSASYPMILPLPDTNELIWFSERSGLGHLYLYDTSSGKIKRQITGGDVSDGTAWLVRSILHYDYGERELLIQTAGRDRNNNPYYRDICKINIDTGEMATLISGPFDHVVHSIDHGFSVITRSLFNAEEGGSVSPVSPSGRYILTTFSRVDTLPVSVLLDRDGDEVLTIDKTDGACLPKDWNWPKPFKLKASDGETDIYGVMFYPSDFNPCKKYPVVDFLGDMRAVSLVPRGSFCNSHASNYFEMAALAELGFIVVGISGRGTSGRSKSFCDHNYGISGGEDDLDDHIFGIKQLASIYPYIDIEKVGVTSMEHSFNVVYSLLGHADFYSVCVSHAYQELRNCSSLLEMYAGVDCQESLSGYRSAGEGIESFKGKLLLICGLMYGGESTLQLAEKLQSANQNFDMLCMPNMGAAITSYTRRRGWDYLVEHLLRVDPPKNFKLKTGTDILKDESDSLNSPISHLLFE